MSSYLSIFQNEERRTNHAHLDEKRREPKKASSDTVVITTRKKVYISCETAIVFMEISFVYPYFVNDAYVL